MAKCRGDEDRNHADNNLGLLYLMYSAEGPGPGPPFPLSMAALSRHLTHEVI